MEAPANTQRRHDALELMDSPSSTLASQLPVLLAEVVRWLPSPFDVASLDCTSRLFHLGAPRSAVEEGLRLRAEEAGRAVEAALPAGETSWAQWLLWEERRLMAACAPPVASCGAAHSAFVDAGGQLLTCGADGGWGILGQGDGVAKSVVPRAVAGLGGVRIRAVSAGGVHTLACSDEGVAFSFGRGANGELGHGDEDNQNSLRVIEALQGVHISAVASGSGHSLALSEAGALYSIGVCMDGKFKHGDPAAKYTPQLVAALHGVRISSVAVGSLHSLALSEAGDVYSFGVGQYGQLGDADQDMRDTPQPIAALQGVRVGAVSAGYEHSLVVSTAGRLYSFGCGMCGQLGHGDDASQFAPRLVKALQGVRVSAVAAGEDHSLALSEGRVYSFGSGHHGKLGHGNTAAQLTPRVIEGLQDVRVRSIAAGCTTSLAVATDGEAYGWGRGMSGNGMLQPVLGLELTANQLVPRKYRGLRLHA